MCLGPRDKDDSGVTRSRDIDRGIRQDEARLAKEVKLLLLGKRRRLNDDAGHCCPPSLRPNSLTSSPRSWRVWKDHDPQADATHLLEELQRP